jgi:hypothetical protein
MRGNLDVMKALPWHVVCMLSMAGACHATEGISAPDLGFGG